jgi:hypothetical protein
VVLVVPAAGDSEVSAEACEVAAALVGGGEV